MSTPVRSRELEARRRDERRRRAVAWGGGLVVVALLAAIVVAVVAARGGGEPGPVVAVSGAEPAHATADGAVPVGRDDAPVTVEVYFDYLCPFCGTFEQVNGTELDALVASGELRIELRPLSFLDRLSAGTAWSTRAANALATVADGSPERVGAFHRALFDAQPEEGTAGPDDEQLVALAVSAGVPPGVADRFDDDAFVGWVERSTDGALSSGVTSTPTVLVDGEVFRGDLLSSGPLTDAVRAAGVR